MDDLVQLVNKLAVHIDTLDSHIHASNPLSQGMDPWATRVPIEYATLLDSLRTLPCLPCQCSPPIVTPHVVPATHVPWLDPIKPFQSKSIDPLERQYAHWCTLLRCLPLLDPTAKSHVTTVALYGMSEILKLKGSCAFHHGSTRTASARLGDSMGFMSLPTQSSFSNTSWTVGSASSRMQQSISTGPPFSVPQTPCSGSRKSHLSANRSPVGSFEGLETPKMSFKSWLHTKRVKQEKSHTNKFEKITCWLKSR
ncbi:hypothetical protein BDF14DRAFT_1882625 [Spinellus fusiger]|nr:hypothetical protein BDF14DRAFT_1882625 [Spinellus fusiger]